MQCSPAQTPLGSNSLNSTFIIKQENLSGTGKPTQQDIQTQSHFMDEELVETRPATTSQRISPHSSYTYNSKKNTPFTQATIQPTVKPSITPKYSQLDSQTFKPVRTSRQTNKQKTSKRNNFSDHNYNFFAKSKITKPPYMNSQNQSQAHNYKQNVPQQATHTLFFNDQPRVRVDRSENYPLFQQKKT